MAGSTWAHTGGMLGLLALAAGHAQAAGPWAVGVAQTLAHESNVFRAPAATEEAATVATTSAMLRLDQPFGRQKLRAWGDVAHQAYAGHGEWNQNPYSLGAELDWSGVDLWEGELGLSTQEQLYRYDQTGANPARNLEELSRAWLRARKGVVTLWTFEAAVNAYDRQFSLARFAGSEQRQVAAEGGLRFQPSPDLALRGLLRYTRGSYPGRGTAGDDYTRDDVELGATWRATGASKLEGRVAVGREDHSLSTASSNSVWAAGLTWNWQPTGKLSFATSVSRDSDTGSNSLLGTGTDGGAVDLGSASQARTSSSLAWQATWAATAKIQLDAGLRYTRRSLDSQALGVAGADGTDAVRSLNLGLRYQPMRSLDLACGWAVEKRTVSGNVAGLSYPYSARTVQCSAQFWFGRN